MNSLCAIVGYTFKQHLRHRVYLTVGLFGLVLLGGSLVAATLAAEERVRLLLDLGLAGIKLLALVAIVFVTVSLILDEIDARSITLILTRPVKRLDYVLGRFLGTFLSISFGMVLMAVLHLGILIAAGWSPNRMYAIALICSVGKVAVVGSLALFLSLFTTSAASAMTFTIFFWIMGHFSDELMFLGEKAGNAPVKALVWIVSSLTPNFSYYNYRDFWAAPSSRHRRGLPGWWSIPCLTSGFACSYPTSSFRKRSFDAAGFIRRSFVPPCFLKSPGSFSLRVALPPTSGAGVGARQPSGCGDDRGRVPLRRGRRRLDTASAKCVRERSFGRGYAEVAPHAEKDTLRVVRIDPYFHRAYLFGAGILAWFKSVDRPEEALLILQEGIRNDPHYWVFRSYAGAIVYQKKEDFGKVASLLEGAVSQPDCPGLVKAILANTYKSMGQYRKSLEVWEVVLGDPDNSDYHARARSQIRELEGFIARSGGMR